MQSELSRFADLEVLGAMVTRGAKAKPFIERYREHTVKNEGCWLWKGPLSHGGYPSLSTFRHGRSYNLLAHRFAYAYFVSDFDREMRVHHECGNHLCVRPDHLGLLENSAHSKLHGGGPLCNGYGELDACPRCGREWTTKTRSDGRTQRQCLPCYRARARERWAERRAVA